MLCQELPAVWYHRSRGQFRKHPVRWLSIYCRRLPVCVVRAPHPRPLACELKLRHLGGARSGKLGCRSQEPALTAGGKLWGECVLVCVGGRWEECRRKGEGREMKGGGRIKETGQRHKQRMPHATVLDIITVSFRPAVIEKPWPFWSWINFHTGNWSLDLVFFSQPCCFKSVRYRRRWRSRDEGLNINTKLLFFIYF